MPPVVPVDLTKTKRVAVNVPTELYKQAAQMARHDRRTIAQWFRVAIEDAIKAQKKRLKEEGITLPEPSLAITGHAPEEEEEEKVTAADSETVQAALKANPSDKLLKIAADDIDVLGGVNKEKLQKLKLLMELLDS